MKAKTFSLTTLALLATILAHCGDGSPTAPRPPAGEGSLFLVDNGCTCGSGPFAPIPIYVDGQQAGLLPVLGHVSISLAPGKHNWSFTSATDPNPMQITIQPGQTLTVNLQTNDGCADGCDTDDARRLGFSHQQPFFGTRRAAG